MQDLCEGMQTPLRVCYEQSFCLSADVTAAYDPNFDSVYEKRNAARVNHGLCLCKYTGARGKSGSSDADAETVAYARRVLDGENVVWQISEMARSTRAAAARSRSTWPTATSPHSMRASRC